MVNSGKHEIADRQGHEYDLSMTLFFDKGMLFRVRSENDRMEIDKCVTKYGRDEAQKYWNHFHMMPRCRDINTQRQWAFELIDRYRERAADICPDYILTGEIRDDGVDIEVTFWVVARERAL